MRPRLSIIVIAYEMAAQLERTLETLRPGRQRGASAGDYEVLVVENRSGDCLSPAARAALAPNARYFLRDEASRSPVPAINFAFGEARATRVGLIIDGARMLSPGVVRTSLDAFRISEDALVAVPGYHLGDRQQHLHEDAAAARAAEDALLASVDWRRDGYELFRIATFSGANARGYLQPMMECNCVLASARNFARIGHADPDFMLPGGGGVNLHIYRSLGMLPGTRLFVLPGEGSFHQSHGGVTTTAHAGRRANIERHRAQLQAKWPGGFHGLRREPELLGEVAPQAMPFLKTSLQNSRARLARRLAMGQEAWPDDRQPGWRSAV